MATNTSQLDMSLNTSKKSLFCNHCMFDCGTYEIMKDHYKSDFHKYNLNRVTNNLNPLNFEEFTAKKDAFIKMNLLKEQKIAYEKSKTDAISTTCDLCKKSFASMNKMNEHLNTKTHILNAKKHEENMKAGSIRKEEIKKNEPELTTLEDINVCLLCNKKNESLELNILHMMEMHNLDIPLKSAVKRPKGYIKLLADKILKYNACLFCDSQNFPNYKAVQNHMIDTNHAKINCLDLEEFLYKFYDLAELLSIKDKFTRKSKEYGIVKIKLMMHEKRKIKKAKDAKEINEVDEDGWATASDEEDKNAEKSEQVNTSLKNKSEEKAKEENLRETDDSDNDDIGPIVLPNGELLLENGLTVGNKMYKVYYKQRYHLKKYDQLSSRTRKLKNKAAIRLKYSHEIKTKRDRKFYGGVRDSNKSSFIRVNTLFKARKQVNV